MAFVVLGCLFRIIRYAQNLPLWSDECFLSVNFINRGYRELLEPLDNGQIAPPLFLWIQRLIIDVFGFSEWSLRVFPLVCGLVSVFLFWHLARRVFGDNSTAVLLAVGIFAVSVHPIRHASEAKPYAADLLAALILLAFAAEWLRRPQEARWLWALAGIVPLCLALSNPAVFVAGGIGLGLAYPVWNHANRRNLLAFCIFGITTLGSFAIALPAGDQLAGRPWHRGIEALLGRFVPSADESASTGGMADLGPYRKRFCVSRRWIPRR